MEKSPARPVRARVAMVVALAVAGFHMIGTFFYTAPSTPATAEVGGPFTAHMRPYFGQSWRIFAPDPQTIDLRIWVRAAYDSPTGEQTMTDWVNLSEVFNAQVHHAVLPARTWRIPVSLHRYHSGALEDLSDTQQAVAFADHTGAEGREALRDALLGAGASVSTVESYQRAEDALYELGSNAAWVLWPDVAPGAVQMSTSTQGVVPFSERHTTGVQRPAESFVRLGWRAPLESTAAERAGFAEAFGRYVP
ncbi:DUF5819 family protein [Oerskovia flava]|uniref:DUF5819 family protein n=1 Tax=Oerskovia flava TaxID=2986422 RepID=UPI00223F1C77|nr:DUF5819 family protein [Oerskovia sp. JB1-3-2]